MRRVSRIGMVVAAVLLGVPFECMLDEVAMPQNSRPNRVERPVAIGDGPDAVEALIPHAVRSGIADPVRGQQDGRDPAPFELDPERAARAALRRFEGRFRSMEASVGRPLAL